MPSQAVLDQFYALDIKSVCWHCLHQAGPSVYDHLNTRIHPDLVQYEWDLLQAGEICSFCWIYIQWWDET